jgi:hypothetical protein
MPDNTRSKLIQLYAAHSAKEIDDDPSLFKSQFGDREALLKNNELLELNVIAKEQRQFIDAIEKQYLNKNKAPLGDPKAQLVECLKGLLNRAIFTGAVDAPYKRRMDVLYELMLAKYADATPPWPAQHRQHLEFLYPKIRDWNLFFFSYTNEGAQILNHEYQALIDGLIQSKQLDPLLQQAGASQDNNLLAEVIVQQLKRHNLLRGFYDRSNIKAGDQLSATIKTACSSSFLFIQLVTRDAFVYRASGNWPFQEYEWFKQANADLMQARNNYGALDKRFLFAIAGDTLLGIKPTFMPFEYDDWYTHVDQTHYKAPSANAALFQSAMNQIALSVKQLLETDWIENGV